MQEHERRRARLLSVLLLILIPLIVLAATAAPAIAISGYKPLQDPLFYVTGTAAILLSGAYRFSRTQHYVFGAMLTVSVISVSTFVVVILFPTSIDTLLIYLVMAVQLANALLSARNASILIAANIVGVLLLPTIIPDVTLADTSFALSYIVTISSITVIAALVKTNDLKQIVRQSHELSELYEEVRQHADLLEQRVARRTAQLEVRARQQTAVARLGQKALADGDPDTLMQEAALLASQALQVEYCAILELLPHEDVLLLRAAVGWSEGLVGYATLDAGDVSRAIISTNPQLVASWLPAMTGSTSVTIQGQQVPFGVLSAFTTGDQTFTEADVQFLQNIANVVAQAIERKRVQVALQEREEKYRSLFQDIPIGLYQSAPDGRMTDANAALITTLGYQDQESMLAATIHNLYVDGEQRKQRENTLKREGDLLNFEGQLLRRDGEIIWTRENTRAIHDASGSVLYYRGSMMDITAQKQAEHDIKRRNRELGLLNEVIAAVTSTLNIEEILEVTCRELALSFEVPQAVGSLLNEERTVATVVADYREETRLDANGAEFSLEDNLAAQYVIEHKTPMVVDDAQSDPRLGIYRKLARERGTVALLYLPLIVRNETIGWLSLLTEERRKFSDQEVELAISVAAAVSQALHNAQLYQKLETYNEFLEKAVEKRTAELQQEKERAEVILESAADGVIMFDGKGHIRSVNPGFEQQTRYQSMELIGQHARVLVGSSMPQPVLDSLKESIDLGHIWRNEIIVRRQDGSEYDADLNMAPLRLNNGGAEGYVGILRDISALKEVERMKDAFVSNVSHELRTPITSLKLLHHALPGAPAEQQQSILTVLQRETDRLHHIVEDVLSLSRLDQGQVQLMMEPVDLNVLAEEYVIDRTALAEERGLTLALDNEPDLMPPQTDKGLLSQVLGVFLTNSINYTPEGGQIVVSTLSQHEDGQEWAGFRVRDTGSGIPPEEQEQLFKRFFRGAVGRGVGRSGYRFGTGNCQ